MREVSERLHEATLCFEDLVKHVFLSKNCCTAI